MPRLTHPDPSLSTSPRLPKGSQAAIDDSRQMIDENRPLTAQPLELVRQLNHRLTAAGVTYCHWKSNNALDRSSCGDNDLDLLIRRPHTAKFSQILFQMGFKQAQAAIDDEMPGVLDYYGLDTPTGKIVHVHAHYRLVLGDDRTKNYHFALEEAYLASTGEKDGFPIPSPEFELIVLVIRLVLKHASWDAILGRKGSLSPREREELQHLEQIVDQPHLNQVLRQHVSLVGAALFRQCLESLRPGSSVWLRVRTARRLQNVLNAHSRRCRSWNTSLKAWRRLRQAIRRRLCGHTPKRRLMTGGVMIAFVGGDGAGKSTAVQETSAWLGRDFETAVLHLGKPAWSRTTSTVRALLKCGCLLGAYPFLAATDLLYSRKDQTNACRGYYPMMIREVCTARDRLLAYTRARRCVNNGVIVICDRFPLPQVELMDGPILQRLPALQSASRLKKFLVALERSYYETIVAPELLFILRLDPDQAVQRKPEEAPTFVRTRSREIWNLDPTGWDACILDASLSRDELLREIKRLIWSTV